MCAILIIVYIGKRIEVVITGLTRNQVAEQSARGFESLRFRQKQSRSNADKMQYIFINGLVGFIAEWQPKPLTYENNYNIRKNGKFVRM